MEPNNIVEELRELVLQHLSFDELKNASEVSKTWNEIVGSSHAAMKKIHLQWNWHTPELYGTRRYANLSIESSGKRDEETLLIKFATMLISLKFDHIEPGFVFPAVSLSNLKTLEIGENVAIKSLSPFFENLGRTRTKIEKLTINAVMMPGLGAFLNCNNQLKELSLRHDFTIFYQPNIDYLCSYRLTKLRLGWFHFYGFVDNGMRANIIRLIHSQSATLTHFGIDECDELVLQAALNVQGLKTIECRISEISGFDLPVNSAIEIARIYSKFSNTNIRDFLALVPNLNSLYISQLCSAFQPLTIMQSARNLRNIYTLQNRHYRIFNFYKNATNVNYNHNIDIKLMKTFEQTFN